MKETDDITEELGAILRPIVEALRAKYGDMRGIEILQHACRKIVVEVLFGDGAEHPS